MPVPASHGRSGGRPPGYRLGRLAGPVLTALAGALLALVWFTQAPTGWPGSGTERTGPLAQERIDEAVTQSLQSLTLPSMAARAAAIVTPSVVRVRSFGPVEAAEGDKPERSSAEGGNPERGSQERGSQQRGNQEGGNQEGGNQQRGGAERGQADGGQADGGQAEGGRTDGDRAENRPRNRMPPGKPQGREDGRGDGRGGAPTAPAEVQNGVGTGVVIKDDGLILSNLHVVAAARRITVVFADGTESAATVTGVRPEHDLAVLKAARIPDDLQPAVLRSTGDLSEGDGVVVVGFPFDIGPSVSAGVISGFNREYQSASGARVLSNLIQFDAAANPGNSGGPLATMEGEVVGIVTAILNPNNQRSFVGIGFAVPIESAMAAAGLPPH